MMPVHKRKCRNKRRVTSLVLSLIAIYGALENFVHRHTFWRNGRRSTAQRLLCLGQATASEAKLPDKCIFLLYTAVSSGLTVDTYTVIYSTLLRVKVASEGDRNLSWSSRCGGVSK